MLKEDAKDRLSSPANQKGVVNCCAALRRLLEKHIRSGNFTGHVELRVVIHDSTIQSYRPSVVLPDYQ